MVAARPLLPPITLDANVASEQKEVSVVSQPYAAPTGAAVIDMSEICRAIWFAARAELAIREACKPAVTVTVWEFLAGVLALMDALSKPTESGRVIAIFKVKARYPELDNWTTCGHKSTRLARSFDIQGMLGVK
jgi:hypothetical protein